MSNPIYTVDPQTKQPSPVIRVSFADIGVKERADLEAWVINYPEILGEPLLVITSEYCKFDLSSKRLDVLALDKGGVLVVIELKLDAAGTLADQQAIRYAAFCSTMTMEQVVEMHSTYHGKSDEESTALITEFLEKEELPELNSQPRIILAAGSMNDQELTACVLWLRQFGMNISCVELPPYKIPGTGQIILVPRVIIPLSETTAFTLRGEVKAAVKIQDEIIRSENELLWKAIKNAFNALDPLITATASPKGGFFQITVGKPGIHYEWLLRKRDKCIDVAIHFESGDCEINQQWLKPFEDHRDEIELDMGQSLTIGKFGRKWAQVKFIVPYSGAEPASEVAPKAAELMKTLIQRTLPLVQSLK